MATIRNNTWCIISHSSHCYLDKIFIFFPCSDSRLQECNYSGPQSKLSKASNLLRWETAIRDSRYSRRGKIRRRRQGGWWEKLASTVQSGVQKNWNSARYIWLFSSSLSFDSMVNVKLDYILILNFICQFYSCALLHKNSKNWVQRLVKWVLGCVWLVSMLLNLI